MIDDFEKNLQKLSSDFSEKLSQIRGHRLSLSFLENLEFSVYGVKYPLKGLAHIAQVSPTKFKVEVWDGTIMEAVEKEMLQRKMGVNIYKEGKALVVTFPPLSQESRKEILRELNQLKEEIRIRSRKARDEFLKNLKGRKERGEVSEDLFFKTKEKVDEAIERFNQEIEKIFEVKEQELLS